MGISNDVIFQTFINKGLFYHDQGNYILAYDCMFAILEFFFYPEDLINDLKYRSQKIIVQGSLQEKNRFMGELLIHASRSFKLFIKNKRYSSLLSDFELEKEVKKNE